MNPFEECKPNSNSKARTPNGARSQPQLHAFTLSDAGTEWAKSVSELGYDDKGDFVSLDEWYPEDANYDKLGDELFEKVMAEHRPE